MSKPYEPIPEGTTDWGSKLNDSLIGFQTQINTLANEQRLTAIVVARKRNSVIRKWFYYCFGMLSYFVALAYIFSISGDSLTGKWWLPPIVAIVTFTLSWFLSSKLEKELNKYV